MCLRNEGSAKPVPHCSGRCYLSIWDPNPLCHYQGASPLGGLRRQKEALGCTSVSSGGAHLLVTVSFGPALPPGRAVPAGDSVEQLQFMCELLISRGELVIVPGTQHSPPQPSCPGMWARKLPVGLLPRLHEAFRWLWGGRWTCVSGVHSAPTRVASGA